MLSRVADAIYWMCRYVERAENLARFIEVNEAFLLDSLARGAEQWQPLISVTGDAELFAERKGEATRDGVVRFLSVDRKYPNSIVCCLDRARDNARSVREAISSEAWEQVNAFHAFVSQAARDGLPVGTSADFFEEVKRAGYLFQGIMDGTMSHNEGWHFARVGRLLERADKTSRILDVKYFVLLPKIDDVGSPIDDLQWSAVLQSVGGFEMYRKRHHGITPHRVVEFLLLDKDFPRAIAHCVHQAADSLRAISGTSAGTFSNDAERKLGQLQSVLAYGSVDEVLAQGLHEFIDEVQKKLNGVDEAIFQTFFAFEPLDSTATARPAHTANSPA